MAIKNAIREIKEKTLDTLNAIGEKTQDAANSAQNVISDASRQAGEIVYAGVRKIEKFAAKRPKLNRTLTGIDASIRHVSGAVRQFQSHFGCNLEVQIPADAGHPYVLKEQRNGSHPVTVIGNGKDEPLRIVFHDASLFARMDGQVILESDDGSIIDVRCLSLHNVELKVRRTDGAVAGVIATVGVDDWLYANGPRDDEMISVVRIRRKDWDLFERPVCAPKGPGAYRSIAFAKMKFEGCENK